jgi:hypothetical protein
MIFDFDVSRPNREEPNHFLFADKPHRIVGGTLRTPGVPETRSCVDCYRRPNRRPASRSAEKLCR